MRLTPLYLVLAGWQYLAKPSNIVCFAAAVLQLVEVAEPHRRKRAGNFPALCNPIQLGWDLHSIYVTQKQTKCMHTIIAFVYSLLGWKLPDIKW